MKILAIDTSTEILSLAARKDKQTFELTRDIDLRHSEELLPLIDSCLVPLGFSAGELDLVVVAKGPGSFTGLRIGLSTAKGPLCRRGLPDRRGPTLDAYAAPFGFLPGVTVLPVIDAKKKAFLRSFLPRRKTVLRLSRCHTGGDRRLFADLHPILITGPHAELLRTVLGETNFLADPFGRRGKGRELLEIGHNLYEKW